MPGEKVVICLATINIVPTSLGGKRKEERFRGSLLSFGGNVIHKKRSICYNIHVGVDHTCQIISSLFIFFFWTSSIYPKGSRGFGASLFCEKKEVTENKIYAILYKQGGAQLCKIISLFF